jgi:hypothetical protein
VPAGATEVRYGAMPGKYARKGEQPMPNYKAQPGDGDIDALLDKYAGGGA